MYILLTIITVSIILSGAALWQASKPIIASDLDISVDNEFMKEIIEELESKGIVRTEAHKPEKLELEKEF
ncbi:hypothetical protein QQ020_03040 [Fulvivirgaceae bacterium BMA12]|uniref:Uncharacterized protein n=1 Tax=Agaribacillus aureus TaxID=3051825 RepID=A0ABT8L1U3_9BACT|nr:hypothetical protein [Fulvivirgaceae bacterium BMA12]